MEKEVKEKTESHLLILLDAGSPVQVAPTTGGILERKSYIGEKIKMMIMTYEHFKVCIKIILCHLMP